MIIGQDTGKNYGTGSDGGKAEAVTNIVPTNQPATRKSGRMPGVKANLTGAQLATAQANGWDPNDPQTIATFQYLGSQAGAQTATALAPVTAANTATRAATNTVAAPAIPQIASSMPAGGKPTTTVAAATPTFGAAGTAQFAANQKVQTAEQAALDANKALAVPAAAVTEANRQATQAAIDATKQSQGANQAEQSYLNLQRTQNQAAAADEAKVQAGANNTPDLIATAQAQRLQDKINNYANTHVLAAPTLVNVAPGQEGQVTQPGLTAPIRSAEDVAKINQTNNTATRGFATEDARISAASAASTANASMDAAKLAGLQAQLKSSDLDVARAAATEAGYNVDQARLDLEMTKSPPAAGQVYNSATGTWMSQQDADLYARQNNLVVDPTSNTFTTAQDLLSRTDTFGNIKRADGVVVDPQNKNEYRQQPDGTFAWTDPKTGNIQLPNGNWFDPQHGNTFTVTNPQTGAGFWTDSQGFVEGAGGVWTNPATGQRKVNGTITGQYGTDAYGNTSNSQLLSMVAGSTLDSNTAYNSLISRGISPTEAQQWIYDVTAGRDMRDTKALSMYKIPYNQLNVDQKNAVGAALGDTPANGLSWSHYGVPFSSLDQQHQDTINSVLRSWPTSSGSGIAGAILAGDGLATGQ